MVMKWLRKRKLDDAGRRRLMMALARAEERLARAHVATALQVIDAVERDLPADRALAIYLEALEVPEPRATVIARRVLARLEEAEP